MQSWAAEVETHMDALELDQVRKCLSAVTRLGFTPSASWKLAAEQVVARRLAAPPAGSGQPALEPKAVASILVSAASMGLASASTSASAEEFRRAVTVACRAAFGLPVEGAAAGPGSGQQQRGAPTARCACSSLWAAAVLGAQLEPGTVQVGRRSCWVKRHRRRSCCCGGPLTQRVY